MITLNYYVRTSVINGMRYLLQECQLGDIYCLIRQRVLQKLKLGEELLRQFTLLLLILTAIKDIWHSVI